VPELGPYRNRDGHGLWYRDPSVSAFHRGGAEARYLPFDRRIHLPLPGDRHAGGAGASSRRGRARHPAACASDDGAVRELFAIDPKVKIIWAHAGMSSPPSAVRTLLDRYREPVGGALESAGATSRRAAVGRRLGEYLYATRSDSSSNRYLGNVPLGAAESENRFRARWLRAIAPAEVAEKIAFWQRRAAVSEIAFVGSVLRSGFPGGGTTPLLLGMHRAPGHHHGGVNDKEALWRTTKSWQ